MASCEKGSPGRGKRKTSYLLDLLILQVLTGPRWAGEGETDQQSKDARFVSTKRKRKTRPSKRPGAANSLPSKKIGYRVDGTRGNVRGIQRAKPRQGAGCAVLRQGTSKKWPFTGRDSDQTEARFSKKGEKEKKHEAPPGLRAPATSLIGDRRTGRIFEQGSRARQGRDRGLTSKMGDTIRRRTGRTASIPQGRWRKKPTKKE